MPERYIRQLARERRRFYVALVALAVVIAGSLTAAGLSYYADRQQVEEFTERVRRVSYDYCLEIEELKANERRKAIENYQRLDETLRLLELERTPEIEARARDNRDRALEIFHARPCPRPSGLLTEVPDMREAP